MLPERNSIGFTVSSVLPRSYFRKRLYDDSQSTTHGSVSSVAGSEHCRIQIVAYSATVTAPSTKIDYGAGRIIALTGRDRYTATNGCGGRSHGNETTPSRYLSPLRLIVERSTVRWRCCKRARRMRKRKDEYDAYSDVIVCVRCVVYWQIRLLPLTVFTHTVFNCLWLTNSCFQVTTVVPI